MNSIIKVEGLSKQYRIGGAMNGSPTLRDAVARVVRTPLKRLLRNRDEINTIWALKDVSFEVSRGEILGIIGRNGAGKSTLLKILSRITEPTAGRFELSGRVGSLLEVGTGFHLELTGRENIYLNGALLGMKRAEIAAKFDEIVAFSEIEEFLDTPAKHYSSGMYMRLAFAVAAHLEPEILLVDEVLAVGDAGFQAKCLGKMNAVANEGRTVLFISHNMSAIQTLCKRAIWIRGGEIVETGTAETIVSKYLKRVDLIIERVWDDLGPGNEYVRFSRACVRPVNLQSEVITIQTPFALEFEYWNRKPGMDLRLSLHIHDERGNLIFATMPVGAQAGHGMPMPAGLFRSSCQIPSGLLNEGLHRVSVLVVRNECEVIFSLEDAVVFDVLCAIENRGNWYGKWPGAVRPNLEWNRQYLDSATIRKDGDSNETAAA